MKNTSTQLLSKEHEASPIYAFPMEKVLKDYHAFFTEPGGADMLPYAYLVKNDAHDKMLQHNNHYSVCSDEALLIQNSAPIFANYFQEIESVIELGPGTKQAMEQKSVPLLRYIPTLQHYYAIDHVQKYLDEACDFVQSNLPHIHTHGLQADFMHLKTLKKTLDTASKRCVISLGITLGNFTPIEQYHIVRSLSDLLTSGELLLITCDMCQDEKALLEAYTPIKPLISNVLHYFANICPEFSQHLDQINVECRWNNHIQAIEFFFVVKNNISFTFLPYGTIHLSKGQMLMGIMSRKFTKESATQLFTKSSFEILDVIPRGHLEMYICRKT